MKVKYITLADDAYPTVLRDIPSPPRELYYMGAPPAEWLKRPRVAMVGSRSISAYGKTVTQQLARQLAERGITIVSGLALGVDAIAHSTAVEAGGLHLAVLAHGLDEIYPVGNTALAQKLLQTGGAILSEYPVGTPGFKQNFIARNRIVAGLSQVLLITEAAEHSGTLHTARFALEQGRDVLVVPGNITNPGSAGCNNLIKSGAQPVTSVEDVLHALHADTLTTTSHIHQGENPDEQTVLDLMYNGVSDGHELFTNSGLAPTLFAQTLTMLELSGKIHPLGNNHWAVS